jgi:adenylylsulfate kinase-like enzyme
VWVDTPLDGCQERDPKGSAPRARAGELAGMTGIDAPYEAPVQPEFRISGWDQTPEQGPPTSSSGCRASRGGINHRAAAAGR